MKAVCAIMTGAILLAMPSAAGNLPPLQTVFVILLENHNWSEFKGSSNAPFINGTLLPLGAHGEQAYTPPGMHPSEPNYLWLEAGTNFGILNDKDPASNHQNTTNHLVTQLARAGITWKAYQEDIAGDVVPLTPTNGYVPRHDPFVFFDDLTGTNDPHNAYAIAHIRPYPELAGDLASNTVARYNFITPNVCDDGHNVCAPQNNSVQQTDDWLASEVPKILNSAAYTNQGAVFITWDEGANSSDGPIGLILLSPLVRGGYSNSLHYTHSSLLRTLQEIFGVSPWLGDAANATDLNDLFQQLRIQPLGWITEGAFGMNITGVQPGTTNFVEASTNLRTWTVIATNGSTSSSFSITDSAAANHNPQFYRVRQTP